MIGKNKTTISRIFLIIITLLTVASLAVPAQAWIKKDVYKRDKRFNSPVSPVIFIPGSTAGQNRFDELFKTLNKDSEKKHSVIKISMSKDNKANITGSIKAGDRQPFIVIAFENNGDGYDNVKKQALWTKEAINQCEKRFQFNNFAAFGHSNGGLIWTYYLEHYANDDIKMTKLMTLGAPFNLKETSIKNKTQMLTDFIKYKSRLPKDLSVYSIAGSVNYYNDGAIPEESVSAGKYIFQNQVKHYTETILTGKDSQHSALLQNKELIGLIEQTLLKGIKSNSVNKGPANQVDTGKPEDPENQDEDKMPNA